MTAEKQKVEDNDEKLDSKSLLLDVDQEISFEISLRHRLVDTLESRIAWATALKEILQRKGNSTFETVRNVALDTLRTIEASSEIVLAHDPTPPPRPPRPPPVIAKPIRPPPRRHLPLNFSTPKSKSFLFIRSSNLTFPFQTKNKDSEEPAIYLLKCPICGKSSFISLQGLLNHGRLVHNVEWGTHEDCISACAVAPDDNNGNNSLDLSSGIEVGLGPTGILPGVRNIFQMALLDRTSSTVKPECDVNNNNSPDTPSTTTTTTTKEALSTVASSLNQSLGLHDETPALAVFLGKHAIRPQIKVTDEDAQVDIESVSHVYSSRKWRMPFTHRHTDNSSLPVHNTEEVLNTERSNVDQLLDATPSVGQQAHVSTSSRFHLVSRIVITDRSLWIPTEERSTEHQKYTHKWMISVDSPSYTHHITTILNSIYVTPADTDVQIHVIPPKTGPPFVVFGLASCCFLAKITLSFFGPHSQVGRSVSEQVLIFDHWVELYPLKESHIIKGQDQVVDIELDKDTIVRPPRRDYTPIESKGLWNQAFDITPAVPKALKVEQPAVVLQEEYERKLAEIIKRFPMTIEDFKGRRNKLPKVPYLLANSVEHLLSFVTGRRKAIEWSRSRAIHEAYEHSLTETPNPGLPSLTARDVYIWLSEKGHFPRPKRPKRQPSPPAKLVADNAAAEVQQKEKKEAEPIWCRFCGLDTTTRMHGSDDGQQISDSVLQSPLTGCRIVVPELQITRLARMDIKRFALPPETTTTTAHAHNSLGASFAFDDDMKSLVAAADPTMVQWIHKLTEKWKLKTFHNDSDDTPPLSLPLDRLGKTPVEIATHLAPHALLSLLTKQFIRVLISRAREVSDKDKANALFRFHSRQRVLLPAPVPVENVVPMLRMLSPTHVLSGIVAKRYPVDGHLLLGMSKLGVTIDDDGIIITT